MILVPLKCLAIQMLIRSMMRIITYQLKNNLSTSSSPVSVLMQLQRLSHLVKLGFIMAEGISYTL